MPSENIYTKKTVQETLSDLRRMFARYEIEDFEAVPKDGNVYSVRYHNGGVWVEIESRIQPSKATNLRQCYQVIDSLLKWQLRGVSGLANTQAFMSSALVVASESKQKASEFVEACGVLGVDPEVSWEEISDVYRVKVKRAHPDVGGDPERFKRLSKAFEIIKKVKEPKGQ